MSAKEEIEALENALKEVRTNLRSIDSPNAADDYIDDSLRIINNALKRYE